MLLVVMINVALNLATQGRVKLSVCQLVCKLVVCQLYAWPLTCLITFVDPS